MREGFGIIPDDGGGQFLIEIRLKSWQRCMKQEANEKRGRLEEKKCVCVCTVCCGGALLFDPHSRTQGGSNE